MKTQVLPVNDASVALAAELLQKGELVALPTETVYGIAADARERRGAVAHDCCLKRWEVYGSSHDVAVRPFVLA